MPRPHPGSRSGPLGRIAAAAAAALAVALLAGCGSSNGSSSSSSSPASGAGSGTSSTPARYPVTIQNCATKLTFSHAPTRAVSNDINATEDMLALGLAHSMVGTFGVSGDGPVGEPVPPPQYQAAFRSVKAVSPDYFTLEPLLGLRPDFLFAGWNYGFEQGTRLTPDGLAKFGIKSLALTESCAHVQHGKSTVSIDNTYTDLTNLGAIFGVPQRAAALVHKLKAQVAGVRQKVGTLKPVSVFVYDSGTDSPFTAPGLATPDALISLAGGSNVFHSLKQSWTSVSWEQVTARKPQCIVINDYGTPTAKQKRRFLEHFPATRDLPAVRNGCILALPYDELTPSPRNADAVVAIAKLLHPAAFGLPARPNSNPS